VATIWCIINLTWMDDEGAQLRISALQKLDIPKRLEYLIQQDENVDVRDRAKAALLNLNGGFPVNDHEMTDMS
jgi:armadillo repeat-containing protein 8